MKNSYSQRRYIVSGIIVVMALILVVRLFYLQVIDKSYILSAQNNVVRHVTQYPSRGLIYDRNGKLLVYNEAVYDLMVVPRQVGQMDTLEFCRLLEILPEDFMAKMKKAKKYSYRKASLFEKQISKEAFAYLEEKLYRFPGFYVQARTLRKYPQPVAPHTLGYIGEVNAAKLKKDPYYKSGDYIGISGLERTYEKELRGEKGVKIIMVDVFNREKGRFRDGEFDKEAVKGQDLYSTLDVDLQAYGEALMNNKRGSVVAIEPTTGEILAMVSTPSYDPNLLVGRVRNKNFSRLYKDPQKPLFNRATLAQYPPGSTFKLVNALVALEDGVIQESTRFECKGTVSRPIVCSHNHYSPLNLTHAIEQSCNPYFWQTFRNTIEQARFSTVQEGYNNWRNKVKSFGIGMRFDSDIGSQSRGNVPTDRYYNKYYTKKGWKAITVRSLSIGQGEIQMTCLQMANMTAGIANRGWYQTPHIVRSVGKQGLTDARLLEKHRIDIDEVHFEPVIRGMQEVYEGEHGSARFYPIDSIVCCGKTGTAQNPHGENHSIFICFAPKDNPKIAVAAIVENSGYGTTWAAPIATLMMEKYLKGVVQPVWYEEKMLNADLMTDSQ